MLRTHGWPLRRTGDQGSSETRRRYLLLFQNRTQYRKSCRRSGQRPLRSSPIVPDSATHELLAQMHVALLCPSDYDRQCWSLRH